MVNSVKGLDFKYVECQETMAEAAIYKLTQRLKSRTLEGRYDGPCLLSQNLGGRGRQILVKTSLVSIASSRPARATHSETMSQMEKDILSLHT